MKRPSRLSATKKKTLLESYSGSSATIIYKTRKYTGGRKRKCKREATALTWIGCLQPTQVSQNYKIKIELKPPKNPRCYLLHPKLELRDGDKPPHIYDFDAGKLCLFMPSKSEWSDSMLLAETIVPWAAEWLFHYEIWLATGDWQGGGEHPVDHNSITTLKTKSIGKYLKNYGSLDKIKVIETLPKLELPKQFTCF